MTNRLIHVIIALLIIFAWALSYLGTMIIPVKINTLVVEELKRATGKSIFTGSIRFDLLKGLILDDLVIYDNRSVILWVKSISCGIPLSSLLEGKLSTPAITIESPAVYLERRIDGSFNLADLVREEYSPSAVAAVAFRSIVVKNARVIFFDRTLDPIFKERIDDIFMDVRLSDSSRIALNLSCSIPAVLPTSIKFSGIYFIKEEELAGRIEVKDLVPDEFKDYYRESGVSFPSGDIDAEALLHIKDQELNMDIDGLTKSLVIEKDRTKVRLDARMKTRVSYGMLDKSLEYAGKIDVSRMDMYDIEMLEKMENIKAIIEFNDSRLWSENILAEAFGVKWKARINLLNYSAPIFDIYADSEARLSVIQKTLKDTLDIRLPTDISGKANIGIAIHAQPGEPLKMNGYAAFSDATISLGSGNFPIEGLCGETQFDLNGMRWSGVKLKHMESEYLSSGSLDDFISPDIKFEAISKDIVIKSDISLNGNEIKISRMDGRYFGTTFGVSGVVDITETGSIKTDIAGRLELELKDLKKMVKNSAGLQKMRPAGKVSAEFSLNGNAKDLKTCAMRIKIKEGDISIYGLRHTGIFMDYVQSKGVGHIKSLKSLFYGGSLYASGKINWLAKALPYSFSIDARDVKLEDLRRDAGFRDKDVSGSMKAMAHMDGTFKDIARLSGNGRVSIVNGRLWQLNLFSGLGAILFTSDFESIVFTEGSCDVKLSQKGFDVSNFMLKSDLLNLYGSGVIGFDKSIKAILRPEVVESTMGSGTQEAIAKAISGNTVIKISGTIDNPELKTQANFADVVGGIAGALFRKNE